MAWSTGRAGQILMVVVHTNVLSATMRVGVEPAVERWLDAQPPEAIWTTTIAIFEIRFGLALLAPGRRRDRLSAAFDRAIDEILDGRVLPFDRSAAETAAAIAAMQRQIGRSVEIRDVQIAGIAAARKATLATRNTRHFADLGITLVDPWQSRIWTDADSPTGAAGKASRWPNRPELLHGPATTPSRRSLVEAKRLERVK